jgi:hypothetical protein
MKLLALGDVHADAKHPERRAVICKDHAAPCFQPNLIAVGGTVFDVVILAFPGGPLNRLQQALPVLRMDPAQESMEGALERPGLLPVDALQVV